MDNMIFKESITTMFEYTADARHRCFADADLVDGLKSDKEKKKAWKSVS